MKPYLMIISGGQGTGKTSFVKQLAHLLSVEGVPCTGFYSEGFWEKGIRSEFDLVEINGGRRMCLCNKEEGENDMAFKSFYFKKEALAAGYDILAASLGARKVVFLDEVGVFEIEGGGWAGAIDQLIQNPPLALVLSVRQININGVLERFKIKPVFTWFVSGTSPANALADLLSWKPELKIKV